MSRTDLAMQFPKPNKKAKEAMLSIRPKKVDGPDVGTYKVFEGVTFVKVRNPNFTIGKSQ